MPEIPLPENPWSDAVLDPMRAAGDELADDVIASLFADSEVAAVNEMMRTLITNEFPEPTAFPQIVRDYLAETDRLPLWADSSLIEAGEKVFWRYGPKLIIIYNAYSLPWDYLGQKGVQVLALTNRLQSNPTRRITEVSQFLVDVLQPGGLNTPGGRGRRSIQKVRLMHGAVRRLAGQSTAWKPEWDLPINQEDMAGTLMSFSWIALDGLEKLNASVTDADREAYLHCWRVIGHLLGIRQELLPTSIANARDLAASIARRQFGPSPEAQSLTKALVDMMAHTLPGDVFSHVVPLLIHYFLGKEWASWLGIEDCDHINLMAGPLRALGIDAGKILESSEALSALAEKVGHLLIESLVYVERGGNRPSFTIPVELRQQWGVNWLS
jgi:hypothetical protein